MNIDELIIKKIDNDLTNEEEVLFKSWINESEINKHVFFRLKNLKKIKNDFPKKIDMDTHLAWNKIVKKLNIN